VHVNHAVLREAELVVIGNVNLTALFRKMSEEPMEVWEIAEEYQDSKVSPVKQK